jgi:hypothetical protein
VKRRTWGSASKNFDLSKEATKKEVFCTVIRRESNQTTKQAPDFCIVHQAITKIQIKDIYLKFVGRDIKSH